MENLVLINGYKEFKVKEKRIIAMDSVNLNIEKGKIYAIMGHSGSGKSTLIQILGTLDNLSSGKLLINGIDISKCNENEKADIRMNQIGFVFQSFYLNPKLTAIENVMLPLYINKNVSRSERKKHAFELLNKFGLANRANHYPKELSGGEQQRVAIARAIVNNPNYILADEPTGNLDKENEVKVFDILKELSKKGKGVVIVSHNEIVKKYADEILYMEDGKLRKNIWQ